MSDNGNDLAGRVERLELFARTKLGYREWEAEQADLERRRRDADRRQAEDRAFTTVVQEHLARGHAPAPDNPEWLLTADGVAIHQRRPGLIDDGRTAFPYDQLERPRDEHQRLEWVARYHASRVAQAERELEEAKAPLLGDPALAPAWALAAAEKLHEAVRDARAQQKAAEEALAAHPVEAEARRREAERRMADVQAEVSRDAARRRVQALNTGP
jgi:hypothetical protein